MSMVPAMDMDKVEHLEKARALLDKIKERKADVRKVTREKIAEDLRKIQPQNASSNDPDGINAINIFPEEVWDVLLGFVRVPEDLENARKACKTFEYILKNKPITDVVILQALKIDEFRTILNNPIQAEAESFQRIFNAAGLPDSLRADIFLMKETLSDYHLRAKLRSLSKSLRHTVDMSMERKLEQDLLQLFDLDSENVPLRKIKCLNLSLRYDDYDSEKFSSFLKNVDPSQRDSPVKRLFGAGFRCSFVGIIDPDFRKYMNDVTTFLSHIGKEVLYFNPEIRVAYGMGDFCVSALEAYNYLHDWIGQTPNLKWLVMNLAAFSPSSPSVKELWNGIRKRPFPVLEKLKLIKFYLNHFNGQDFFESMIFAEILERNPHLQELVITCKPGLSNGVIKRIEPYVQNLSLKAFSFTFLYYPNFYQILNPNCPLQKIHLHILPDNFDRARRELSAEALPFFLSGRESQPTMNSLFDLLHNFKTLTHVALDVTIPMRWIEVPLELPNVTNFSLRFKIAEASKDDQSEDMRVFNSVDFLIPMSKLKELKWINDGSTLERIGTFPELIKFEGGSFDLHSPESNIWDVFPSLRIATVQVNSQSQMQHYFRANRKLN